MDITDFVEKCTLNLILEDKLNKKYIKQVIRNCCNCFIPPNIKQDFNTLWTYIYISPFIGTNVVINTITNIKESNDSVAITNSDFPGGSNNNSFIKRVNKSIRPFVNHIIDSKLPIDKKIKIIRHRLPYVGNNYNIRRSGKTSQQHTEEPNNPVQSQGFIDDLSNCPLQMKSEIVDRMLKEYKFDNIIEPNDVIEFKKEIEFLSYDDLMKKLEKHCLMNKKNKQWYMKNDTQYLFPIKCNHTCLDLLYRETGNIEIMSQLLNYVSDGSCIFCNEIYSTYISIDESNELLAIDYMPVVNFFVDSLIIDEDHKFQLKDILFDLCNDTLIQILKSKQQNTAMIQGRIQYYIALIAFSIFSLCGVNISRLEASFINEFSFYLEVASLNTKLLFEKANKPVEVLKSLGDNGMSIINEPGFIINKLNLAGNISTSKYDKIIYTENPDLSHRKIPVSKLILSDNKEPVLDAPTKLNISFEFAKENNIFKYFCPISLRFHKFKDTKCELCGFDFANGLENKYYDKYKDLSILSNYNNWLHISAKDINKSFKANQKNIKEFDDMMKPFNIINIPNNSDFIYQYINNAGIKDFDIEDSINIYKTLVVDRKKDGLITPSEIHDELLRNII